MSKKDLAYFAGFFDGEGCIVINKGKRKKSPPYYCLQCRVASVNQWIIQLIRFHFGGKVYADTNRQNPNWRQAWTWVINGNQALVFLKEISPFLKLKKAEADIAIHWEEERVKGCPLTDEDRAVNEAQKILLQSLKRRVT